ncbi:uncharacterized protein LOC124327803 [Daphnia pulicaria]|uniref:uncharacterized protein LOC124327803 n=1 Tax=Daphnia pulicaria TaxID=35523 RepID=UPI001EEA2842|nr:uncharacterized protein LOC124327803 [Daphnia pulicaria]
MKLALILLVCFVGATYQQGYAWSPFYHYSPHLFFYNNYDQANRQFSDKSTLNIGTGYSDDEIDSSIPEIQARIPFGHTKKPQKKFFITSILPNSFFNFKPLTITTLTSTVFSTITSTAVIATVQSCLPATMFFTSSGPSGFVTLTSACGRRRRDIDESSPRQITAEIGDSILPSVVSPLETSSVVPELDGYNNVNPEITSSQTNIEEEQRQFVNIDKNSGRQNRALSLLVTVTSTSTSFSFSTTTIKKTINLSGPAQLSCMPSGFALC